MLQTTKTLQGYAIGATDGPIGKVKDFYFDDQAWVIRYLVVDTGSWLSSRKVLISPIALGKPDWSEETLPTTLTKAQVEASPDIDTEQTVTRQHETNILGYYGYPHYWNGGGLWGGGLYPYAMLPIHVSPGADPAARPEADIAFAPEPAAQPDDDQSLRSCEAVIGYHIQASDGEIGHVTGFLIDPETWAIRYMVVNTSNWWLGHEVLIAPPWISGVNWAERSVSVDLTQQALKQAPEYDASEPVDRDQETAIYTHYGRDFK